MPRTGKLVRIVLVLAVAAVTAAFAAGAGASTKKHSVITLNGAGSTFVAPLVVKWSHYTPGAIGIKVNYNAIGSGGGIQAITNKEVDFGGSDAPLSQFDPTCTSCVALPWALAGTAIFYNIPNAPDHMHMTGQVLAKIYLGKITHWNAAPIKKLNPTVKLPGTKITPVYRSDSSGTSFNFTDYLSSVSPAWANGPGRGTSVSWPAGTGGTHSSGVAAVVTSTPGALGYAEAAYPAQNKLHVFLMKNQAGKFLPPKVKFVKVAAESGLKPGSDGGFHIVNPPAQYKLGYPISTFTYIMMQKHSTHVGALKKFVKWAISAKGQSYGGGHLFFVPIPSVIHSYDIKQLKKVS